MQFKNNRFTEIFGGDPEYVIKAPGRTELGGNHTDHQHGKVLCAPVNLCATAYVKRNHTKQIQVVSEGHPSFCVDLQDTGIREEEFGQSSALVRGVADAFLAYDLPGFDVYITSDIPAGSGLSSSAAIEILLGRICCTLTGIGKTGEELAILGQYVENKYFGKPCGLMDQMACAAEGILTIDFQNPAKPVSEAIPFRFQDEGYSLCIINCGAGHENLTSNYADITIEIQKICHLFGKEVLREIPEEQFMERIQELRRTTGDRAVLRALHVYAENQRVTNLVNALKNKDMDTYLDQVRESGRSSWELLQNVIPEGAAEHQEMAFALAMAEKNLRGKGAVRVHGGGFAGTIQAYVPLDQKEMFQSSMEAVLGKGSCIFVTVG